MENRKKEVLIITIAIIIQTAIYIFCGIQKSYIHMDEAYSLGLASYDKVEIQDAEDFYNTWHTKEYYEDYLSVQDYEVGKYSQVYENQKNDVHPPLYYLFLRFAMGFTKGHYSKWSGITVNITIFAFITMVMYCILKILLQTEQKSLEKSAILAFIASITMASLTNVIYIRMYALSTLNILITSLLHLHLLKQDKPKIKLLIFIGLSALIGSLTHYYFLFYLAMMYIIFAIKYIKQKNWKMLITYTVTMAIAAIISLLIFPYSIQHMFFGYRGQGVIDKLKDVPKFFMNICAYILKVDRFGFNDVLSIILLEIVVLWLYKKCKYRNSKEQINKTGKINNKNCKNTDNKEKNEFVKILALPTLFYFIVVAIASPWIELRYIMPICGLLFVLVIYCLYKMCNLIFSENISNIIVGITLVIVLIAPAIFKIEPEVMFSDKKEIVEELEGELNVPTLYMFNSENNRFLDDILLFSELDNSYIAKDIECTRENINAIMQGKDLSKGMIVFINEGQENDDLLHIITEATGLKKCEYLKRLNACDVYFLAWN